MQLTPILSKLYWSCLRFRDVWSQYISMLLMIQSRVHLFTLSFIKYHLAVQSSLSYCRADAHNQQLRLSSSKKIINSQLKHFETNYLFSLIFPYTYDRSTPQAPTPTKLVFNSKSLNTWTQEYIICAFYVFAPCK